MEKTFTIEEWDAYAGDDMAATMYSQNTSRYYDVELYKVIDTVGTCPGTLGDTTSVRRVLAPLSGYSVYGVQQIFNNQWFSYTWATGDPTISKKHYSDNPHYGFRTASDVINASNIDADKKAYLMKTASNAGFYMTMDMKEEHDGYFWIRLYGGGGYIGEYVIDTDGKDWQTDIAFPFNGNWQKKAEFKWNKGGYNNGQVVWASPAYAKVGFNESVQMEVAADGSGSNAWILGTTDLHYKALDLRAPQQVGIANLAFGHYKKGDQISVTVIYDEVIKSAENVGFTNVSALPISNVKYVAGAGTNALTFTATVTADDFEVTPDVNNAIKNTKPVTGTVKDVFGN